MQENSQAYSVTVVLKEDQIYEKLLYGMVYIKFQKMGQMSLETVKFSIEQVTELQCRSEKKNDLYHIVD